mgnify:CR=1 FL=1
MTSILLAEDNITLLEDITLELDLRGYTVIPVANGQEALNYLRTTDQLPDIIVSDIAMPDMDGFALLETLRNSATWNSIPFLFLTAFNSPNSMRISKELGADDYIVKPFHADDLIVAMESKIKRVKAFKSQADRDLDKARKTLMHMISHELRTPLSTIYGGTELLAESVSEIPDETVHRMVELIRSGTTRLNRFTKKTITLLEADSGSLERMYNAFREPVDFASAAKTAISTIQQELKSEGKQIAIKLIETSEPVYVDGVYDYLVMMVEEPLRNAVTFTPDGGTVEIVMDSSQDSVTVTIIDNGPGIAETDLPRIWDRFVQVNRGKYEQQGAGLGLAVVRECAQIHKGSCTISSVVGMGTRFTLTLPVVAEPSEA